MPPTALEFDMLALGSRYLVSLGKCSLNLSVAKATKLPTGCQSNPAGSGGCAEGRGPLQLKGHHHLNRPEQVHVHPLSKPGGLGCCEEVG